MKKNYSSILVTLFLSGFIYLFFWLMYPQFVSDDEGPLTEFSTKRAVNQIKILSFKPHYVSSKNHDNVANYLLNEMQKLGLETSVQEGYTLTDWGNLVKSKNIMARIKGTDSGSKALLLLSHYDSAPHSNSYGASDAGSGVATIMESIRAFLYNKTTHKNDIIILFTDAEELGLNGAALFATQHQWAKDIGVVLNFEARGSSGPSYMLMETNGGNAGLVKSFNESGTVFPVSNSLMYSIYKMLPNDTDLTVFREQANIQGYNFAFIDGHYNYHSEQDDIKHIDRRSIEHQGSYLMPMLKYFSNAKLSNTITSNDSVYFTIPFIFISYPFEWIAPMVTIAAVLLIILILIGVAKRDLSLNEIFTGFIPLIGTLLTSSLVTFFGWKITQNYYPQYQDLINGFTYNGHWYIAAFVFLTIAIWFVFYAIFSEIKFTMEHFVAPLFIWIIANYVFAYQLKGAAFLIIPVYFGLLALAFYVFTQKSSPVINFICAIPAIVIIVPFIQMFPIGLGLKFLYGSALLTILSLGLILPLFGTFYKKGFWALTFFIVAIFLFVKADYESNYEVGKAKPNSLVYVYNVDAKKAYWTTYDTNLDSWTKTYLGNNPKKADFMNKMDLYSKYNSKFTFEKSAAVVDLPKPTVEFIKDYVVNKNRHIKIRITPNRKVNRYDIFANENINIFNLIANGVKPIGQKGLKFNRIGGKKILSYYVVNNEPLELEFSTDFLKSLNLELLESSFDLTKNPLFNVKKRENWMMPTPFVLNDAVVLYQKINSKKETELNDVKVVQDILSETEEK